MLNEDNAAYYKYTGPQRFDKAIHTLEGIIRGIAVDGKVSDDELSVVTHWIGVHREFADRHPFNEVIPRLHEILADGIIDEEEKADILWLCNKFTTDEKYFCHVTADMQRLQGMLGGIAADNKITKGELQGLKDWMAEHEHLRTCWPYDEIDALIIAVLQDNAIDEHEHRSLIQFFGEFAEFRGHRALDLCEGDGAALVTGVCAVAPEIVFTDRRFCFTGRSEEYSRQALADEVTRRGGIFGKSVTRDTDYLTIGADGNPCWAYACYGRKVEQAIQYRKDGCKIVLVHEYDLRDALEDTK
ncbi:MAG: BRCT domain-containing protein [Pirellulales bacterium]